MQEAKDDLEEYSRIVHKDAEKLRELFKNKYKTVPDS